MVDNSSYFLFSVAFTAAWISYAFCYAGIRTPLECIPRSKMMVVENGSPTSSIPYPQDMQISVPDSLTILGINHILSDSLVGIKWCLIEFFINIFLIHIETEHPSSSFHHLHFPFCKTGLGFVLIFIILFTVLYVNFICILLP